MKNQYDRYMKSCEIYLAKKRKEIEQVVMQENVRSVLADEGKKRVFLMRLAKELLKENNK